MRSPTSNRITSGSHDDEDDVGALRVICVENVPFESLYDFLCLS